MINLILKKLHTKKVKKISEIEAIKDIKNKNVVNWMDLTAKCKEHVPKVELEPILRRITDIDKQINIKFELLIKNIKCDNLSYCMSIICDIEGLRVINNTNFMSLLKLGVVHIPKEEIIPILEKISNCDNKVINEYEKLS